jgi:hypothetical protein
MSQALGVAAVLAAVAALTGSSGFAGTYRSTVTAADLRAVGTPADIALVDAGTWTLVVGNGSWTLRQAGGPDGNAVDRGDVAVSGPVAKFTLRSSDGHRHHVYDGALRWHRSGTGLRFSIIGHEREDVAGVLAARLWVNAA